METCEFFIQVLKKYDFSHNLNLYKQTGILIFDKNYHLFMRILKD